MASRHDEFICDLHNLVPLQQTVLHIDTDASIEDFAARSKYLKQG